MNTIEQRAEQLVRNEVYVCLSGLVSTLAKEGWTSVEHSDLADLCEQAFDLCTPLPDYEEAARDDGWELVEVLSDRGLRFVHKDGRENLNVTWGELCDEQDIDPHEREIFEHWSVSSLLANDLIELGERVDTDFAGLCVWGRTTTGQGIAQDHVIRQVLDLIEKRASAVVASFTSEDA